MKSRTMQVFTPPLISAVVGLAFVFATGWITAHVEVSPALRIALALPPLVAGSFFIVSVAFMIRGMDEMHRRIHLETATITFLGTVFLAFVWGALQRAGLYTAHWDDLGNPMMVLWAVVYVVVSRRYR